MLQWRHTPGISRSFGIPLQSAGCSGNQTPALYWYIFSVCDFWFMFTFIGAGLVRITRPAYIQPATSVAHIRKCAPMSGVIRTMIGRAKFALGSRSADENLRCTVNPARWSGLSRVSNPWAATDGHTQLIHAAQMPALTNWCRIVPRSRRSGLGIPTRSAALRHPRNACAWADLSACKHDRFSVWSPTLKIGVSWFIGSDKDHRHCSARLRRRCIPCLGYFGSDSSPPAGSVAACNTPGGLGISPHAPTCGDRLAIQPLSPPPQSLAQR